MLAELTPLNELFDGRFCITQDVERELITKPLLTKRFEFEALQVLSLVEQGVLKVVKSVNSKNLDDLSNNIFYCRNHPMRILHAGELSSLQYAVDSNASLVIDERTTRVMVEDPLIMSKILRRKLHCGVRIDQNNLKKFSLAVKGVKIIRSAEVAAVAYMAGLLNKFKTKSIPNSSYRLIDGIIWGVKLNGCSITEREIKELIRMSRNRKL